MAQQFEQPQVEQPSVEQTQDAVGTGRAQRMTADESRAVIDLWQQERTEQTGLTDKPAVPDVAEGLDITIEDVQRLLQDVRAKRIAEERALATEHELSEIRLAEEERKLAEIRRQRAELDRQKAEAQRRQAIPYTGRIVRPRRVPQSELGALYIKQEKGSARYKGAALGVVIVLSWLIWCRGTPHSALPLHVTHASATYDAQGKATLEDVACADRAGNESPCDMATISNETAYMEETHHMEELHDNQLAAAKANAEKEAAKNVKQTHRGSH